MPRHMPVFEEDIPEAPRLRTHNAIAVKRTTNLHWLALAVSLTALLFI